MQNHFHNNNNPSKLTICALLEFTKLQLLIINVNYLTTYPLLFMLSLAIPFGPVKPKLLYLSYLVSKFIYSVCQDCVLKNTDCILFVTSFH